MLWEIFQWVASFGEAVGVIAIILLAGLGVAMAAFKALARITGALAGVDREAEDDESHPEPGDFIEMENDADGEWTAPKSGDPGPDRHSLGRH